MVTCFIAPLSIIIFSYSQLLGALRAVSLTHPACPGLRSWSGVKVIHLFLLSCVQVAAQQAESVSTQKAEKEVSRMIIVMVGSFLICYGPYSLAALYFAYSSDENKDYRLVTIPAFFSKSSCVYNPLIYAFMNKQVSR